MYPTAELELIDLLGGCEDRYKYLEHFAFDGDRTHALRSIELMRSDGVLDLWIGGARVEDWQLSQWRRAPYLPDTSKALGRVRVSLTDDYLRR